jgi:hypothetical protein
MLLAQQLAKPIVTDMDASCRTRCDRTVAKAFIECCWGGVVVVAAAPLLAAALHPAPPAALAFIVLVGVALPMAVAYQLPLAVSLIRAHRTVAEFRRDLARLPETPHPLEG